MTDQPVYTIRIAAQLVGVHQQTLRTYEREGLLAPARSAGRQRLYSQNDIDRLLMIRRLIDELGVNIAGADIILRLRKQIDDLETQNRQLKRELQRIRDQQLPAVQNIPVRTSERSDDDDATRPIHQPGPATARSLAATRAREAPRPVGRRAPAGQHRAGRGRPGQRPAQGAQYRPRPPARRRRHRDRLRAQAELRRGPAHRHAASRAAARAGQRRSRTAQRRIRRRRAHPAHRADRRLRRPGGADHALARHQR